LDQQHALTARLAPLRAFTMVSVQFPPGVKHTLTAEGVVVARGDGPSGAGVGVGEDATRGWRDRQNSLSGHWSQRPLSPQT
jgi:hypothetical protein